MIYIIRGAPGQGKSYLLALRVWNMLWDYVKHPDHARMIYSNMDYNLKAFPKEVHKWIYHWDHAIELNKMTNGTIIMDEAQTYFDSQKWDTLDERIKYKMQQHRHERLDVWGAVQNVTRLEITCRELVQTFFSCNKLIGSADTAENGKDVKHPWGLIRVNTYISEDMSESKARGTGGIGHFYWIKKEVCDFYNTRYMVNKQDPNNKLLCLRYKVCKECGGKTFVSKSYDYT